MINTVIDLCKTRNEIETNFIGKMLLRNIEGSSYYHTKCPIKNGVYDLTNYKVDDKLVPTYLNNLKVRFIQKIMIKPVNAKKMFHCSSLLLYSSVNGI